MVKEELLSCPKAAAELGVAEETVRNWVKDGKIAHVVLPSGYAKIPRSEVDRILTPKTPA